jgi:hypothetical protein
MSVVLVGVAERVRAKAIPAELSSSTRDSLFSSGRIRLCLVRTGLLVYGCLLLANPAIADDTPGS